MHLFLVILISVLATVENILPSIIGFQKTPADYIFLGTVHHANDYFYYLSQFSQGTTHWITTTDLFTGESLPDTLIGWSNVLTGHLFHLFGVPAIPAYHISIALWTFLLCLSAYQLALFIFKDKHKALFSLVLFVLYHAFPIMQDNHWTYADYWNNFSVPRIRFGGVPHQLLLNTLSITTTLFLLQQKRWLVSVSAFLLASLQPVLWLLIVIASGISALIQSLQTSRKYAYALPTLLLILSGLPAAIYLHTTFATLPFSQLKAWEATQQVPLTVTHFVLAMGPIFILALFSLRTFIAKQTYGRLVVVVFSCLSLFMFMSKIPEATGLTNIRFLSTLTILCIAIIATEGLMHKRILFFSLTLLLFTLLIPNHLRTINLSTQFSPTNAYEYLSKSDVDFLTSINTVGTSDDTFLVLWPYNSIFPALTGRKSYNGHPLLTINTTEKDALAAALYDQKMTNEKMQQFFLEHTIRFVIAYPWQTHLNQLSYLEAKKQTPNLILYEVLLHP